MSPLTRRQLLAGGAAAAGMAATRARATAFRPAVPTRPLPAPSHSGLDHIVVVMMENRSFDHYLGWVPGADGKQAGLRFADPRGDWHDTHHLLERQGCSWVGPKHGYVAGRVQLNRGRMDGFRRGGNDDFALGYYHREDLPFYGALVDEAVVFDRWFCSILAPTEPNRLYSHAGRTDRIRNTTDTTSLPTIWDRLDSAGVPAAYYFNDVPFLSHWGERYIRNCRPIEQFFVEAERGLLPHYCYLEPMFIGERFGGSNDDHPHADIHRGQAFLSQIAAALVNSPLWPRTALVITYDEWGGFFDHVRPPRLPDDRRRRHQFDHAQAGFRVPAFVLSPYAPAGAVDHRTYDHASILKLVEWRFGLKPLAPRDRAAGNIAHALDFGRPRRTPPRLPVVPDPGPHVCLSPDSGLATEESFWPRLLARAQADPAWRHLV